MLLALWSGFWDAAAWTAGGGLPAGMRRALLNRTQYRPQDPADAIGAEMDDEEALLVLLAASVR